MYTITKKFEPNIPSVVEYVKYMINNNFNKNNKIKNIMFNNEESFITKNSPELSSDVLEMYKSIGAEIYKFENESDCEEYAIYFNKNISPFYYANSRDITYMEKYREKFKDIEMFGGKRIHNMKNRKTKTKKTKKTKKNKNK